MTPTEVHVSDPHVARAIEAMTKEPARRWTVAALSRHAGLSRAAFARRFKNAEGIAPLHWLARHRLRSSEELLRGTDLPLCQIASAIGYESEFAFSKAFKRLNGVAPGVFRRLERRPSFVVSARAAA